MRILLDTNVLLRVLLEPTKLGTSVLDQLSDPENDVLFSAANIWEVAVKAALGRPDFSIEPKRVLDAAKRTGFKELPINSDNALRVAALPPIHRDPFDRILVAQALSEPAHLLTTDRQLAAYPASIVVV
jgi:PIN domain nuclease of toxin-antitoxin system